MIKRKGSVFTKGLKFMCKFCGGKNCKHEDYTTNLSYNNAFEGLNSNWITNKILAMQRPSSRIMEEYGIIEKFKVG